MNLPKLKYSERCVRFVDYSDLEDVIKAVYGIIETPPGTDSALGYREFSIVGMEEWGNCEDHSFSIKKEQLDRWDKKALKDFMLWPYSANYILRLLLIDMCNNDHVEPGEYVVQVFW